MKLAGPESVGQPQRVAEVQRARHVEQVKKIEPTRIEKIDQNVTGRGADPVAQTSEVSKTTSLVLSMVGNIEKGQGAMDQLISSSLTGKSFSNSELIALQAGMYKYSQELDLCSKVVEKATGGLKDTLKTQV